MPNNVHKFFGNPEAMATRLQWVQSPSLLDISGATPGAAYIIKNAPCDIVLLDAYVVSTTAATGANSAATDAVKLGTDADDDAFSTTCTITASTPKDTWDQITLGSTIASRTLPAGRHLVLTLTQVANASDNVRGVVLVGFPTQTP